MDRFQYSKEQRLKQDTAKFLQKYELYTSNIFYDDQIEQLNKKCREYFNKTNYLLKRAENIEKILTQYISDLNNKIYPKTNSQFYDEEKKKINLSNISKLKFLQNFKKAQFIKDQSELEDNVLKFFNEEEYKFSEKILTAKKIDNKMCEIFEDNKRDMSLVHKNCRQIMSECEKHENRNLPLNFQLETVQRINKSLIELYNKEYQIYIKKSKLCSDKEALINRNEILEVNENKSPIKNINSNEFNSITNTKKKVMQWFKENKSKRKNPYIIINNIINNNKYNNISNKSTSILTYSSSNIKQKSIKSYSKSNKKIFNNHQLHKNKKFLLKTAENNTPTKINTISTSNCNSIIKTLSVSDKSFHTLAQNDASNDSAEYNYDKKILNKAANFLSSKIINQKNKIANIKNKITEQTRDKYQIKNLIFSCIEDVSLNIKDIRISKDTNNKKSAKLDKEIENNINMLKVLNYIYYNCLDGIMNYKCIFPEFRNNKNHNVNKICNLKKCFSFTKKNFFKGKI